MSDEGVGERHGAGYMTCVNATLDEQGSTDDITDMTTSCVSEEENGNTESASSTSEECTSDEDDTGIYMYIIRAHMSHNVHIHSVYIYLCILHCTVASFTHS